MESGMLPLLPNKLKLIPKLIQPIPILPGTLEKWWRRRNLENSRASMSQKRNTLFQSMLLKQTPSTLNTLQKSKNHQALYIQSLKKKNALNVKQREFGVINIKPTASNDDMNEVNEFPNVASKMSVLHEVNEPPNMALKECKVKEILNGILDCKVLRTSSTQDLSAVNKSSKANASEEIPENCPDTSSQCSHVQTSKLVTVKEILGEILDYSIFKKSLPAHEERRPACEFAEATSSRGASNCEICRSEANVESRRYQIFRTSGPLGIINSSNAMHSESFISSQVSKKSLNRMLPSYSAVLRLGPKRSVKSIESFIPRLPPPSYAEVEGLWEDSPTLISSDSVVFGPDPVYMVCPACRTVVVTDVERERSNVTHLVALVLCVFLCWPCCLLPYCLKSCNYSYHSCPNCRHYFGVYNPF
ncbi:uncharacterized protein [Leptinotarsa decemlineata]|uniref:uncharacterized protein n=1 Tax=Leptinotarsa decemlineata TaxID=7539 RepID=UPI003D309E3F